MAMVQEALGALVESSFECDGDRLIRTLVTRGSAGREGTVARSFVPRRPGDEPSLDSWWRQYLAGHRPRRLDGGTPPTLTTVELFCGPGGLGLGFEQAAMELGYQIRAEAIVDQDAGAVDVYERNRPGRVGIAERRSVTDIVMHRLNTDRLNPAYRVPPRVRGAGWEALAKRRVDVVLAGPPCQGHSNLNNKTRRIDPRNELYLRVPAMAVALDAQMVVIENVPSVVHDALGVVEATKKLLSNAGYAVRGGTLSASQMGWPQTRSRYFLVARKIRNDSVGTPDATPLDIPSVQDDLRDEARSVEWAWEGLSDDGDRGFMFDVPEVSDENRDRMRWLRENDEYDLPNEQRPDCHKNGTTYNSVYGRMRPDLPAQTITTGFFTAGRGRYIHPNGERVINAAEAARLQGFPDTYDFRPADGVDPSRSQLGKWIGDAVPMPLGFAAGLAVLGAAPVIPRAAQRPGSATT